MTNHISNETKNNILKQLFVSNIGYDKNDGTIDRPFKSLNAARDYIRKSHKKGGFTVYIRQGIYELNETFELNSLDSGTIDEPNIYKAYDNEEVKLVGGRYLKPENFIKTNDNAILNENINPPAMLGRIE